MPKAKQEARISLVRLILNPSALRDDTEKMWALEDSKSMSAIAFAEEKLWRWGSRVEELNSVRLTKRGQEVEQGAQEEQTLVVGWDRMYVPCGQFLALVL